MVLAVKAGLALVGEDLEARKGVCIWVREGIVESIGSEASCPQEAVGRGESVVLPQPANAHVHSADHIYPEYGVHLDIDELVAPPHGLKHRLLASTSYQDLVDGARRFYTLAWRNGTGLLIDFRELGGVGCTSAKAALNELPGGMEVLVLGRPGPGWPEGCDGLGISSPLDYSEGVLSRLVSSFRPAMAHVAETMQARLLGDLELATRYKMDGVVHGVHLSPEDLALLRESGAGLVLCVRSNMWHGIGVPPLRDIVDSGILTGIGTDNASWIPPDLWEEARTLMFVARLRGVRGVAGWVLRSLFIGGYRIVGREPRLLDEGRPASFLIFDGIGSEPGSMSDVYYWVLKRVGSGKLSGRVDGGRYYGLGLA